MTFSQFLSRIPPALFWYLLSWVRPILANVLLWFILVRPLRPARPWRIILALLLALDAAQAPILLHLGGSYLMPDLPAPLYAALELLRGLTTLLFLELVILWPVRAFSRRLRALPFRPIALALLLANAALLATAFANALLPPRVTTLEVPIPGLPPALDGYRILHITDIHADPIAGAWRTRAIVRRANAALPDLVCITGDFADGSCARLAPALAPLGDLRAPDGIHACTGNHEYYPPAFQSGWPAYYATIGIHFLDGATTLILRASSQISISAIADNAPPNTFVPPLPGDFRIFLKHRPVDLAPAVAAGADLILSGHTHGGQFPPLTCVVSAANEGHLSGLCPISPRTLLHVSPGAGQWNGLPFRLFRPPALPLLVLRSTPPSPPPP